MIEKWALPATMARFCILTLLLFLQAHVAVDSMPRRDVWDYVSFILTFALVVIGGITFWEVRRQAIETALAAKSAANSVSEMKVQATILTQQTEAIQKSANAALLSAQAAINTERPWLVAMMVQDPDKPRTFFCRITNQGNTPAKVMSLSANFTFVSNPDNLPAPLNYSPMTLPDLDLIVHGDAFPVHPGVDPESMIQKADLRAPIYDRRQFLLYYGKVVYRDTLYSEDSNEGLRETRWCFIYNPVGDASFVNAQIANKVGTFKRFHAKEYSGYT